MATVVYGYSSCSSGCMHATVSVHEARKAHVCVLSETLIACVTF